MKVLAPRPRLDRRGHSLVELMVAASILIVSLMGALRSQISSVQLMKEARETEIAVEVLNEALARLQLESNAELTSEGGDYGPDLPMVVSELLSGQSVQYSLPDYSPGDPVPSLLTLRVQLSWTSRTGIARTLVMVGAKR